MSLIRSRKKLAADRTWLRKPRGHKRRRRVRLVALGVVAAMAIAGGVWLVVENATQAEPCTGMSDTAGDGFELKKLNEQCIGWIVEHDHAFGSTDHSVTAIISKITEENRQVRDQPGAGKRKPYVRVGLLMPMTAGHGSSMRNNEILHALQGAYAAQKQANEGNTTDIGDPSPLIQLVLANEGADQSKWPAVIEQLGGLKAGDHPLVAVTGLGISVSNTRDAAQKLSDIEIPSIGSVLTADTMTAPWLFKVAPSNLQYARSINRFLEGQPAVKTGYMVFDRNGDEGDDEYVRSLREGFISVFDRKFGVTKRSRGFYGSKENSGSGTPLLFADVVSDVCATSPDVIFYAGRGRDLPALVAALATRAHCQNPVRPLAIATGATGLVLQKQALDEAMVGVLDAAATDTVAWNAAAPHTPRAFAAFRARFNALGFSDADLEDGYAIMHRDAVAAAVWAARRATRALAERNRSRGDAPPIPELPTPKDVRSTLFSLEKNPIPGASGAIYFTELPANDLWPVGKPVPIIRIGNHVETWSADKVYLTE